MCFFVYIILLCAMLRNGAREIREAREKVDAEPMKQHENQSNAFNDDTSRACKLSRDKLPNATLLYLHCLQVSQICSQAKTAEEKRRLSNIILDCIAREIEAYPELIGAPPGIGRSNGFLQDVLGTGLGNVLFGRAAEQMASQPNGNVGDPVRSGQAANSSSDNGLHQDMRIQAGTTQEPQRGGSFVDSMLSMFDSNNDGFLTKVEARKAASQFDIGSRELKGALNTIGINEKGDNIPLDPMSEQIKRICVEKFNYMDSDKSGTISLDEVLSAIQAFNMPTSISLARQIFDSVDSNKDGEIDLKEFLAFLASVKDTY
ncbi:Calhepatin [Taenia crassiceps]|uniref:Calhepatin n=1 Tax=Taenia crassiceps TaxID=6207 RepID=A0ABR4QE40_9CEST